ncbi:MAG: O-antigen ligase family protein [Planctomycetota bacterium]|nr:O-antigen ligase family protein [Planctomycetota bacterium]MDI6787564.1 O-antigen ligase family protein [Planctomycetota bacterium]
MSKIGLFCDKVIEGCWIAALVVAPLFLNFHTSITFDPDKSILVRSIALLMLTAFIIRKMERADSPTGTRHLLIIPLLLALSYLISTFLSVLPAGSWWGSYSRGQGTYSLMGYFVIFFITAMSLRTKAQLERMLVTITLTSIPIIIYGFAQKLKLEPLNWDADFSIRIASTLGNPIFLGSYLILVIPVMVYLLICSKNTLSRIFHLLLLVSALVCLLLTESRGPLLGLILTVFVFVVLSGLVFRKKYLAWGSYMVVTVLIGFFIILAIPQGPLEGLKPKMGRLSRMFEPKEGAAQVRLLIWEGIIKMVQSDYYRAIVGYGPETMFVPYHKYCPAELITSENRITFPDRAHNEFFDTIITTGLTGSFIYLLLFVSVMFYVFQSLGLLQNKTDRFVFIASQIIFVMVGVFVPILLKKAVFLAIGVPAGIIIAGVFYLFYKLAPSPSPLPIGERVGVRGDPNSSLLVIALFSAILGHFLETQFGIALTAARTYLYFYLAVIIVLISRGMEETTEKKGTSPIPTPKKADLTISFIILLILSITAFDFVTTQLSNENLGLFFRAITIIAISWLIYLVFCYIFYRSFILTALVSAVMLLLFIGILLSFLPPLHIPTKTVHILYLWVFANIILLSWCLPGQQSRQGGTTFPASAVLPRPVYLLILAAVFILILVTNINPTKGDIIYKIGSGQEKEKQWEVSLKYYEDAIRLSVDKGNYYGACARVSLEKYYREKEPKMKAQWRERCQGYLIRSINYDALNPTRNANLARFYRVLGRESVDINKRNAHFREAIKYYETACNLSPQHPVLRNESGELYHEMGDFSSAINQYNIALLISPEFSETYSHLGDAYLEKKDITNALKNYLESARIQAKAFPDLRDPNQEAMFLRTNQTLIKHQPQEYVAYYNLGRFYRDKTRRAEAIDMFEKALALIQGTDPATVLIKDDITRSLVRLKHHEPR